MPQQSDSVTIFLAGFAMVGTVATLIVNAYILTRVGKVQEKTRETHELVNGLSHELNLATSAQATAEGRLEGERAERDRQENGGNSTPQQVTVVNAPEDPVPTKDAGR